QPLKVVARVRIPLGASPPEEIRPLRGHDDIFRFLVSIHGRCGRHLQGRHRRRLYLVARIASVRFCDLNWMQLEEYLGGDDRVVLPVGSTEQYAYLSLETDNIIAERLAVEPVEPLGVPVSPVLAYGVTDFDDFPGSPTLS